MKVSECAICMTEFTYSKGIKICCCPDCSKERNRILCRWNLKLARAKDKPKKKAPKNKKVLSVAEVNELAREKGMSYGEYIARTEGGMR